MTDRARPTSTRDLASLLEERRRYEAWLAALEDRKESTPQHVFDRVRGDYRARLDRVAEQLSTHQQAIAEERAGIESRLSLLEAEERMHRDERAELELRTHVGELSGEEADSALRAIDETTTKLALERTALERRLGELRVLAEGQAKSAAAPSERNVEVVAPSSAAPAAEAAPAQAPPAAVAPPPLHTPGGSFDELAFLDAVVSKEKNDSVVIQHQENAADDLSGTQKKPAAAAPSAPPPSVADIARRQSNPESLLAGIGGKADEAPLAANVTSNTPIVLRATGATEQSKTLKCAECGGMNYPTEWYCERCGAELAAL